jgi:hypothetical protein
VDPSFLLRGLAIGFTVAMVVGPISLLTIRRTLVHGRGFCGARNRASPAVVAPYGMP